MAAESPRPLSMSRSIALLRGMNLGGRRLEMSKLKALFEALGFREVSTFIASGNVVFSTRSTPRAQLEKRIAAHLEESLGYDVETFVRSEEEIAAIAQATPFSEDELGEFTLHVGFLHEPLPAATAKALAAIRTPVDEFRVSGSEYYWLCRIRSSDSEVWKLPALKALKLPSATLRNITTIRKMAAKYAFTA